MKKNINGFGKIEIIVVLTVVIVLIVFGVKVVFNVTNNKYYVLKKEADSFLRQAIYAKDTYPRGDDVYYLYYLLNNDVDVKIRNPFNKNVQCDRYESYVKLGSNKETVLKCSNYLIVSDNVNDTYVIYELGTWSEYNEELEQQDFESSLLYNYTKNGTVMCNFAKENELLDCFLSNEKKEIYSIDDIDDEENEISLISKVFYRTKKIVKKSE